MKSELEKLLGGNVYTLLVYTGDHSLHVADVSDIAIRVVDPKSRIEAIEAFLREHHMTPLSQREAQRHGFPPKRHERRRLPAQSARLPRR